jgi:starch phosphorylase
MNGAVTIGTLDGANIELRDEIGEDNMYVFGLGAREVQALRASGAYSPWEWYQRSDIARRVMDALSGNLFCQSHPGLFRPLHDAILYGGDRYMLLADLESYVAAHDRITADVQYAAGWRRKALLNVAGSGYFSSDRAVREYARDIWQAVPVPPVEGEGA